MSSPYESPQAAGGPPPQYPYQRSGPPPLAVVSMILGIVSLLSGVVGFCCGLILFLSAPMAVAGLITGVLSIKDPSGKGFALAGLITSGLTLLLCLAYLVFIVVFVAAGAAADAGHVPLD